MGIAGALRARWGRTGRAARRTTAAAAAALAAGAAAWGVAADGEPPVRSTEQRITVPGGPEDDPHVTLDTTFYEPAGRDRAPAILLAHGFGGSKDDVAREARGLARDGYAVLTWSARGFGRSTGHIGLNSPDHEVQDVPAARSTGWRGVPRSARPARRPARRHGRASYGGAIALMAAAHDPRIDAIAPRITWTAPGRAVPEGRRRRPLPRRLQEAVGRASSSPAARAGRLRALRAVPVRHVRAGRGDGAPRTPQAVETARGRSSPSPSATASRCPR